jgi:hypothetical protein
MATGSPGRSAASSSKLQQVPCGRGREAAYRPNRRPGCRSAKFRHHPAGKVAVRRDEGCLAFAVLARLSSASEARWRSRLPPRARWRLRSARHRQRRRSAGWDRSSKRPSSLVASAGRSACEIRISARCSRSAPAIGEDCTSCRVELQPLQQREGRIADGCGLPDRRADRRAGFRRDHLPVLSGIERSRPGRTMTPLEDWRPQRSDRRLPGPSRSSRQ